MRKEQLNAIIEQMEKATDLNSLHSMYRIAIKALHPDNNDNESDINAIMAITDCYNAVKTDIMSGTKAEPKKQDVSIRKESVKRIRREYASVKEFFSCDGSEQLGVLTAMIKTVATIMSGVFPKADNKQITDKCKSDAYGNFDGIRTYQFVTYVRNSNGSFNEEKISETANNAWVKLYENSGKEEYQTLKVKTLLWISCRQALYNTWYDSVKTAKWFDRTADVFDLNAYQTTAPIDWSTESTAVTRVYIEEMDNDKIMSLYGMGYTVREISEFTGIPYRTVAKRLEYLKATVDCERIVTDGEVKEEKQRSNVSPIQRRKSLIMQCIRYGMSYKRIAFYIGITPIKGKDCTISEEEQIKAMLKA